MTRMRARDQADAWERLAGRWSSDLPVDREIGEILRARTAGREISLWPSDGPDEGDNE